MINISEKVIKYVTKNNEVITIKNNYKQLRCNESDNGELKDLKNNKYDLTTDGKPVYTPLEYIYDGDVKFNHYLNTALQLNEDFINNLKAPEPCYFDIETNKHAIPKKNKKLSPKARITSIAWKYQGETYFRIVKGSYRERDLIKDFLKFLQINKVQSLVGHNIYNFDLLVLIGRAKVHNFRYDLLSPLWYQCNIDTMAIARPLMYSSRGYIRLDELAKECGVDDHKINLNTDNPVTLYKKALYDDEALELFKEYNIQDVELVEACMHKMNVLDQLTALFKLTRCPFTKMSYNSVMLNSLVANRCWQNKIIIPDKLEQPINLKTFKGGHNHIEKSETLIGYKNVANYDIVSYYPNLLRLFQADPVNTYDNINRESGDISKFGELSNGILGELAKDLFMTRVAKKQEMKQEQNPEKKERLNKEQTALKIIVNSLYGVLGQKHGVFMFSSPLIASTVTKLGRTILKHIIREFGAVYGKTDGIFIPLQDGTDPEELLTSINNEVSKFTMERFNLPNQDKDNNTLLKFELDSVLSKLVVKSKNEYVKYYQDGNYVKKGGGWNSDNYSQFKHRIIDYIVETLKVSETIDLHKLKVFIQQLIHDNTSVLFYSETFKLSENTLNYQAALGRQYMDDHNIHYVKNFDYKACMVEGSDYYHYILYPEGHVPDGFSVNRGYIIKQAIDVLAATKVITKDAKDDLYKKYKVNKLTKRPKTLNSRGDKTMNARNVNNKDSVKDNNGGKNMSTKNINNKDLNKDNNNVADIMAGTNNNTNTTNLNNNTRGDTMNNNTTTNANNNRDETMNNKTEDNITCISLNKAFKELLGLKELVINRTIKVLPANPDTNYQSTNFKFDDVKGIDNYELSNIGKYYNYVVLTGYGGVGCIDIDSKKLPELNPELTMDKALKIGDKVKDIIVSRTRYPFIVVKTKSDGYHLYYHSVNDNKFKLDLVFPTDVKLYKGLGGQSIESFIEVHQSKNHTIAGPCSFMAKEYKIVQKYNTNVNLLKDEKLDISLVEDILKEAGFKQPAPVTTEQDLNIDNADDVQKYETLKLTDESKNDLSELYGDVLELTHGYHNHNIACLVGELIKHGVEDDIIREIMEEAIRFGDDDDYDEHITQVQALTTNKQTKLYTISSLKSPVKNKTQLDEVKKLIKDITYTPLINDPKSKYYYLSIGLSRNGKTMTRYKVEPQLLGKHLTDTFGLINMTSTDGLYKIDKDSNTYVETDVFKLRNYMNKLTYNVVPSDLLSKEELKNIYIPHHFSEPYDKVDKDQLVAALKYVMVNKLPEYNKVAFKNGVYDMITGTFSKPEKPVFTHINTGLTYNPNAKGEHMKPFIESIMHDKSPERTKERVKGLLELIGYMFISGNPKNILTAFTGVAGSGKSTLAKCIGQLSVTKNSNVTLQQMRTSPHAFEPMVGAHLNIISELETETIKDTSILKRLTGEDDINVNPKGSAMFTIPPELVPKTIITCNNLPEIKADDAFIDRLLIVEFKNKFRGTSNEDSNLRYKLTETDELEWLLYNSLKAYQDCEGKLGFRTDYDNTVKLLNKHTKPLNDLIDSVIDRYDISLYNNETENMDTEAKIEYSVTVKTLNRILIDLANKDGSEIPKKVHSRTGELYIPHAELQKALSEVFDLDEYVDLFEEIRVRHNDKQIRYKIIKGLYLNPDYLEYKEVLDF